MARNPASGAEARAANSRGAPIDIREKWSQLLPTFERSRTAMHAAACLAARPPPTLTVYGPRRLHRAGAPGHPRSVDSQDPLPGADARLGTRAPHPGAVARRAPGGTGIHLSGGRPTRAARLGVHPLAPY